MRALWDKMTFSRLSDRKQNVAVIAPISRKGMWYGGGGEPLSDADVRKSRVRENR
jgi:hypothetical protein